MASKQTTKPKCKTKPKIIPDLAKAEALASRGLNNEQIAHAMGFSPTTLYVNQRENAEFAEALAVGKAKGIAQVANALFEKAKGGDVTAIKFYLSVVGKWQEISRTELTGADGKPIQASVKNEGVDGWEQVFQKMKAPKKS